MWARTPSLATLLLLLSGCPAGSAGNKQPKVEPCRRFGQQCEVSPGKLGACVERTGCTTGDCFVCQSQH